MNEPHDAFVACGALGHRRVHQTRREHVDANAVSGIAGSSGPAQPFNRGLRRGVRVGREMAGRWRRCQDRAHVENGASATLAEELTHRRSIRQEHRRQVQVERRAPCFVRHVMQRAIAPRPPRSAGDVIERVEAAERPQRGGNRLGHRVGERRITAEDECRRTEHLLRRSHRRPRQAERHHAGAFAEKASGRTETDAARPADDDDRATIQGSACLRWVGLRQGSLQGGRLLLRNSEFEVRPRRVSPAESRHAVRGLAKRPK